MDKITRIRDAKVVTPFGVLTHYEVVCQKGQIICIERPITGGRRQDTFDGAGLWLLPGLIDIHNDSIETALRPRGEARLPYDLALIDVDIQAVAFGITGLFHGVRLADDLGIGPPSEAGELIRVIHEAKRVIAHHHVHLRVEITSSANVEIANDLIGRGAARLVSIMDHTPGQGQFTTAEDYIRVLLQMGYTSDAARSHLERKIASKSQIPKHTASLINAATDAACVIASHDDDSVEKVSRMRTYGATISEFPLRMEVAQHASECGMSVVVGAPNVVRGQSSRGNASAVDMIQEGVANIIVSDYHFPSLLNAVFKLHQHYGAPLHEAVALASTNPAKALGLSTWGSLTLGADADMILVDWNGEMPIVKAVFLNGALVYRRQ